MYKNTTMLPEKVFEQSVIIHANATIVEQCITDDKLMHKWINPLLRCEKVGESWSTDIGSRSRFVIQIPFFQPTLHNIVVERQPGLVVWGFEGFFMGRDRWECQPQQGGTLLVNRFEFTIPNPLIAWGFQTFAQALTKQDMQQQLQRLKRLAEELEMGNKE
jgi:Polyketide cyclase / dehydrase and lipid transport